MTANEKFYLKWNDFESNISLALRDIKEEKDFFDCTVSCGAQQIQTHKLILAACSPFFKDILKKNPHPHPLLYLKNINFSNLINVLNFMYHGEVSVAQEELNTFLAVAEDLKVKGLSQNLPDNTKSQESETRSNFVENSPHISNCESVKKRRTMPSSATFDKNGLLQISPTSIKTEPNSQIVSYDGGAGKGENQSSAFDAYNLERKGYASDAVFEYESQPTEEELPCYEDVGEGEYTTTGSAYNI